MKKTFLLVLFLIFTANANCQQSNIIRFIHEGNETKPVGNLVFSVGKTVKVTGSWGDVSYGHSYMTDVKTFMMIGDYVRLSKYTVLYLKKSNYIDRFRVENYNGKIYYLNNYDDFFHQLQLRLKKENMDKKIIDFLAARYSVKQ